MDKAGIKRQHTHGRFRKISIIATLFVFMISIYVYYYWPRYVWGYYLYFRGGDLMSICVHRRAAIDNIWDLLSEYKEENSHWPRDREEFEKFAGSLDNLLEVPRGREGERYMIHFAALESPTIQIVIDDPGIRWPPMEPPKGVIKPSDFRNYLMFRPVLLNNGDSLPLNTIQEEIIAICIQLIR